MPAPATSVARRIVALGPLAAALLGPLAAALLAACGGDPSRAAEVDEGDEAGCSGDEVRRPDGRCQAPGLPLDLPCPPGELAADGACLPAGVPAEACADGFAADDARGCAPVLPEIACPPGQMAVPGEASCREVAPCGDNPWGDLPVEASTQFVDGAYAGDDSDGSREKPWRTIQDGVDAAEARAIVAVAAGRYAEGVVIVRRPVRLWGRCPRLVEVAATEAATSAVDVRGTAAAGSEVRGLAITGVDIGVLARFTRDVTLDQVWIHDNGERGVGIEHVRGATVRRSLIEQNHVAGVFVFGASARVESSVVRATQMSARGTLGRGVVVQLDREDGARGDLVLSGSLIEQNHEAGVFVQGSDAAVDGSVVRGTEPNAARISGFGIGVVPDATAGVGGTLAVRRSLVEQSQEAGVLVLGSNATVESSVVRGTRAVTETASGAGIVAQDHPATGARGGLLLRSSVIEQNQRCGVFLGGTDATIEAAVIRATKPVGLGEFGRGVCVQRNPDGGERGKLALRASVVEENREIGVFVSGSEATVETSIVRDTKPELDGTSGRGISVQSVREAGVRSELALRSSIVEKSQEIAVAVVESDAVIETSIVRGTLPWADGRYGDGIGIFNGLGLATVSLAAAEITDNARAGLLVVGGDGVISGVRSSGNRFGLVLQDGARPTLGEGNQLTGNSERDTIVDGTLPVPDVVSPVP